MYVALPCQNVLIPINLKRLIKFLPYKLFFSVHEMVYTDLACFLYIYCTVYVDFGLGPGGLLESKEVGRCWACIELMARLKHIKSHNQHYGIFGTVSYNLP
jgi:hypothetical protein